MRFSLIGPGNMGKRYIHTLATLGQPLSFICSRHIPQFNFGEGTQFVQRYQEAILSPLTDGVIIATPPSTHYEIAKFALTHNKHVICEKPFVFCPQQARELRALAHERRRNFIVDFIHLWQPPYLQFKQYQSGNTKFRDITLIGKNYGPFRRDYSALWDYAPHDIALALDIMGEYPYSIEIFRTIAHRDDRNAGLYEIVLKFDNGIAHIETGNLSPTRRRFYEIRLLENYQGATNEAGRFSFEDERQFAPLKIMLARFIEKCDNKERWDNLDLSAQVTDVMVLLEKITQK